MQSIFQSPVLWGGAVGGGILCLDLRRAVGLRLGPSLFHQSSGGNHGNGAVFRRTGRTAVEIVGVSQPSGERCRNRFGKESRPPLRWPKIFRRCTARLDELPGGQQNDYLVRRLRAALNYVRFRGNAEALDDELKYLADMDAARIQAGFGLFRVIIWAIPILGFLGTVIGITMALNGITGFEIGRKCHGPSA